MPATSGEARPSSLVTGGAHGIGRAISTTLAERGDTVVVCDRDGPAARSCARDLAARGLSARAVELDVSDVAAVRAAVAEADAELPLTTLVNNAGVALLSPVLEVEPEDYDRVMDVNLRGLLFVMQAALRVMVPRGAGSVVNVSSTSAFTASTSPMGLYDASKAAVRMLTQSTAREVARSGVRVNAVAPGTVETALTRGLSSPAGLVQLAEDRVPMGRLGRAEEVACAVAYLSCEQASYVTGTVLVVDGGWLS